MDYDRIGSNEMRDNKSESNPQKRKELNLITPEKARVSLKSNKDKFYNTFKILMLQ